MRRLALALALSFACTPENGPLMRPGEDCLFCHGGDGGSGNGEREREAKTWTIAGTVYPSSSAPSGAGVLGALVHVTDAKGFSFTLRTNEAGNFYSAESVAFPLSVTVGQGGAVQPMAEGVAIGACNLCHTVPPASGPLPAPPAGASPRASDGCAASADPSTRGGPCSSCAEGRPSLRRPR
jgi:hypothetical protein